MDPHKLRELVLLLLYNVEIHRGEKKELIELLKEECKVSTSFVEAALKRAEKIFASLPQVDEILEKISHSYSIDRLHAIERNVLRLGIYELVVEKELPSKVVIAEAKRLAKKFSTSDGATFVQTLLVAAQSCIA